MDSQWLYWKTISREFLRRSVSLSDNHWLLSLATVVALALLMFTFYLTGQLARETALSLNWLSITSFFVLASGLLAGLVPIRQSESFQFLPLSHTAFFWKQLIGSLRYPLVLSLAVLAPFYLGAVSSGYYTPMELVFQMKGILAFTVSLYIAAMAAAAVIKKLTAHKLVRFILIVGTLLLFGQFVTSANMILTSAEGVFASPTLGEVSLLVLGAVGVVGASVALIESSLPHVVNIRPRTYFWSIFTKNRNFYSIFGASESSFVRQLLYFLRNAAVHQRLAVYVLLLIISLSITAGLTEDPTTLNYVLLSVVLGLTAHLLSFKTGQETERFVSSKFFLPQKLNKQVIGSFSASGIVFLLVGGILGQYLLELQGNEQPINLVLILVASLFLHTTAFALGRHYGSINEENVGYVVMIVLISTLLLMMSRVFGQAAEVSVTFAVVTLWGAAISFLTWRLFQPSRA